MNRPYFLRHQDSSTYKPRKSTRGINKHFYIVNLKNLLKMKLEKLVVQLKLEFGTKDVPWT